MMNGSDVHLAVTPTSITPTSVSPDSRSSPSRLHLDTSRPPATVAADAANQPVDEQQTVPGVLVSLNIVYL